MRLVCPSCRANYEIDASLLPAEGREVQCSSCSFIWFQEHPSAKRPAPKTEAKPPVKPTSTRPAGSRPDPAPPQAPPEPQAEDRAEPEPAKRAEISPRKTSPEALEILRQEAEFEAKQRAREADGLETQPDLGLMPSAPWPSKAQEPAASEAELPKHAPKDTNGAFPDIEDISKSLDPLESSKARDGSGFELPATAAETRRGFLRGLSIPLLIAAVLILLYTQAPAIVNLIPASEPIMTSYVMAIDTLRLRLGALISG